MKNDGAKNAESAASRKKASRTATAPCPARAVSEFDRSLDTLCADDLGPLQKQDKAAARRRLFQNLLLAFFVAVFLCSLAYCAWRVVAYRRSKTLYDNLSARFEGTENDEQPVRIGGASAALLQGKSSLAIAALPASRADSANGETIDADADFLASVQLQLAALRKINGDIGGWIRMQGDTSINYPFVFSHDDTHYLTYAADGTYNPAGAIFLDCRNKKTLSENCNTVLYGHNMYSGSPMFANLHKFSSDKNFWKNNHFIELYTDEGLLTYAVFAAYSDSPEFAENCYFDTTVKGKERMQAFLDRIAERNILKTSVTVNSDDKVLTLCTCADAGANRFVVHAKLMKDKDNIN